MAAWLPGLGYPAYLDVAERSTVQVLTPLASMYKSCFQSVLVSIGD